MESLRALGISGDAEATLGSVTSRLLKHPRVTSVVTTLTMCGIQQSP